MLDTIAFAAPAGPLPAGVPAPDFSLRSSQNQIVNPRTAR